MALEAADAHPGQMSSSSPPLPGVRFAPGDRRARLMAGAGTDLVVDVGANTGQYARRLREAGYAGRIVSFEPGRAAFEALQRVAAGDAEWACRNQALGRHFATATLHLSADDRNSSVLLVNDHHVRVVPDSRLVDDEQVSVEPLDAVWPTFTVGARCPYLKIDVQGYELEVLLGARNALAECGHVEVELSLAPLYEPGPLLPDILGFLIGQGFQPIAFEGVLDDVETGAMLQVDGVFHRR